MSISSKQVVETKFDANVVGASATNQAVSKTFYISFLTALIIDLEVSAVTDTTGITAKLQVRQSNDQDWIDSKTVTIDGNGTFTIALLDTVAGDQPFLPLRSIGRIVVSTGADDAVTVDKIFVPTSVTF